jgi:hypothetical protein
MNAAAFDDVPAKEVFVETVLHEIGHALEQFYGLAFSEGRVEGIVEGRRRERENHVESTVVPGEPSEAAREAWKALALRAAAELRLQGFQETRIVSVIEAAERAPQRENHLTVTLSLNADVREFVGWSPEQVEAFMAGLATALSVEPSTPPEIRGAPQAGTA